MSGYLSIHLAERPKSEILPTTFSTRRNKSLTGSDLSENQVLVRVDYLSLDPAMRGWLNDARSYVPPVRIGEVMRGNSIATVVASRCPDYIAGEQVLALTGWTEYAVVNPANLEKLALVGTHGIQARDYQSVLGMTSLTAYFGMINVAKIRDMKKGSTVVISGAAGAVSPNLPSPPLYKMSV